MCLGSSVLNPTSCLPTSVESALWLLLLLLLPACLPPQDFLRHSQQQLPALSTASRDQPFTNIIWALACWEHTPPTPWLQEFCR